ncbi:MAG TPA: hypothetical protein VN843_26795, partial [Anaerolineales bacterium]|nr:hypothetical protein [Anaerolineales bacterium]
MANYNMKTSADPFKAERRRSRRMIKVSGFLLILSFLLFLCQLINFGAFDAKASSVERLPVSIRAESQADYSQDPHAFDVPAISENILNQIIRDIPATGQPQERMGTLQAALSSPVPTMTPDYRFQPTPTPNLPLPTGTKIDTVTHTPLATATKYVSPTPTITNTHVYVANNSLIETSTKTPSPATKTSMPSPAPTSIRTQTPTV